MADKSRRFFIVQGRFFILYRSRSRYGITLLLGPGRYRCLSLLFLLCLLCTISVRNAYRIQYNQYILTIITSCVCILSYLFTTMVDPGIVWDSREMDLENDPNSVYCSICGVYRPKLAGHCVSCNVCFDEWDHHCSFLGVCIAKRNQWSYRFLELSFIIVLLFAYQNRVVSSIFRL